MFSFHGRSENRLIRLTDCGWIRLNYKQIYPKVYYMKNLSLAIFISFFFAHVGYSDTYVWEDYDDFSGSSLDTSKWEVGYFSEVKQLM